MRPGPAALVLAAGASRRLGQPKALVETGGRTLLEQRIAAAAGATGRAVHVALGHHPDPLRRICERVGAIPVLCPHWDKGIGGTLADAAGALRPRIDEAGGLLVVAVDQHDVGAEELARLVAAWQAGGMATCAAHYAGAPGLPVIFSAADCSILDGLSGDRGAKRWLASQPSLQTVPMPGAAADLDTADDLRRLRAGDGPISD